MDAYEVTRIVFSRIQDIDPENVSKIIGYFLVQDLREEQMRCLAFGSNSFLLNMVSKAKNDLGLYTPRYGNVSHIGNIGSRSPLRWEMLCPQQEEDQESAQSMNLSRHQSLPSDLKFRDHQEQNYGSSDEMYAFGNGHRRSYSMTDVSLAVSPKPCIYFARGFCKHGNACRFSHDVIRQVSVVEEDSTHQTLERLEFELRELLKGRRSPVSIAFLPQLYYERFGKVLQADGYLTESQRHGRTGYSLTNLLARLKNTVTLIDRPHGQHAVVLTEDFKAEQHCFNSASGCRQIYMTFPAESTFNEEDVSNYFSIYGPVQDVRIPYQQKRMFGFVTYVFPETVKLILSKGNPHYVCGARVLVKPYKEKTRKNVERAEQPRSVPFSFNVDAREYEFCSGPGLFQNSLLTSKQIDQQEQELAIEFERLCLTNIHSTQPSDQPNHTIPLQRSFTSNSVGKTHEAEEKEISSVLEDPNGFTLQAEQFRYLLDVLDSEQNDITDQSQIPECQWSEILDTSETRNTNFSVFNHPTSESSNSKIALWSGCW